MGINQTVADAYHKELFDNKIHDTMTYRGISILKSPMDLWNYQEIIWEMKPLLIVEFGCYKGGSTLFFADLVRKWGGQVLSIDINPAITDYRVLSDTQIEIFKSNSIGKAVAYKINSTIRTLYCPSMFVILDSHHTKEHVLAEMELLRPILTSGDYLVVEDSNINGHPVIPNWELGEGPYEAILEYERRYPNDYAHDKERETKFGFTFAPNGFLIRR